MNIQEHPKPQNITVIAPNRYQLLKTAQDHHITGEVRDRSGMSKTRILKNGMQEKRYVYKFSITDGDTIQKDTPHRPSGPSAA